MLRGDFLLLSKFHAGELKEGEGALLHSDSGTQFPPKLGTVIFNPRHLGSVRNGEEAMEDPVRDLGPS